MRLRRDPDGSRLPSSPGAALAAPRPTQTKTNASPGSVHAGGGRTTNPESPLRLWWKQGWLPAALLAIATILAYWPCLHGGFVWDDDAWTLKLERLFQSVSGLGVIWTNLEALQQYYPLSATTFWLDYQLWGFVTTPYHVENILLHVLAALLFWKLLKKQQYVLPVLLVKLLYCCFFREESPKKQCRQHVQQDVRRGMGSSQNPG